MKFEYKVRKAKSETGHHPILFMIHGYGADMNDLFGLARQIPEDFVVISLQAPRRLPWGGYSWYGIAPDERGGLISDAAEARESLGWMMENIEALQQEYHGDTQRTYLMGFSQGCILSLALAANQELSIKGVLALSGYLNLDFVKMPSDELNMGRTAIFQSHGVDDAVIPLHKAEETRELLTALDMDYTFKTYPAGHGIHPDNWLDALRWLHEH